MFGCCTSADVRSGKIDRDPYYVYAINFNAWLTRTVLARQNWIYLVKNDKDRFEIVCRRKFLYTLVVYTSKSQASAMRIYEPCKQVLNQLATSIPWFRLSTIIESYSRIMHSISINTNWTATHLAARIGLDGYLSNKHCLADLNTQVVPDLVTPMHLAIQQGHLSTVNLLLSYNPNLTLCDIRGNSLLHFATLSSSKILTKLITIPGIVDLVYLKNNKGCTPVHLACFARKLENVRILLLHGLPLSAWSVTPPRTGISMSTSVNHCALRKEEPIVKLTEEEVADVDSEMIPFGGTLLHWIQRSDTVEKFLNMGYDIEARNLRGDTALTTKVKQMRLKSLITLLCKKADVNSENESGSTALYYAVRQGDIAISQALIVFDADIDHCNGRKESIRHTAATSDEENAPYVLYVLSALGAKRCPPKMQSCNEGCSFDGCFDGKRFAKWPLFTEGKFYMNQELADVIQGLKTKLLNRDNTKLINMVGFDGGGVKGLITVQMVHELQKKLKHSFIDYFDWLSGTSTGSILAVAFAIGKTTQEIRSLYFRFKDKVMTGHRPYPSELIESLLQNELGQDMKMVNLYQEFGKYVVIPATLVDRVPVQLHLFRSYPFEEICSGRIQSGSKFNSLFTAIPCPSEQLVWKAIRASCAAPTYFSASGPFVDGGIVANNPTMDMLTDFQQYNYALKKSKRQAELRHINTVLSFGTGQINPRPFSLPELSNFISWNLREMTNNLHYVKEMLNIMIDAACNTDFHTVDRIESWCSTNKIPFFRLNPNLQEIFSMDETKDIEIVDSLWMTKVFMYTKSEAINELVHFLESSYHQRNTRHSNLNTNQTRSRIGPSRSKVTSTAKHKSKVNT